MFTKIVIAILQAFTITTTEIKTNIPALETLCIIDIYQINDEIRIYQCETLNRDFIACTHIKRKDTSILYVYAKSQKHVLKQSN